MSDQKSSLIKEMEKSVGDIRKKDGLEKAIKDFMKNPSMAVPVDMRSVAWSVPGIQAHHFLFACCTFTLN
jgi:hypothetical protein